MTGVVLGSLLALVTFRRVPARGGRAVLIVPVSFLAAYAGFLHPGASYPVFLVGAATVLGTTLLHPGARVEAAPPQPFVVAAVLVAYLCVRDAGAGAPLPFTTVGGGSAVLLLWFLRRALREGDLTAPSLAGWSSWFLSLCLITGGLTGHEWIDCRYEYGKCTVAGRIYIGIFPSENVLGILAAATAILVVVSWRRPRHDLPRLVLLAGVLLLAGSRTPLLALAIGSACTVAGTVRARQVGGRWHLPRLRAWLLPPAMATVGIVLVLRANGAAFSNRTAIWAAARSFVGPSSLVGVGENRYRELGALGTFRGHYPHSQYLLLLFFGGLVALALHVLLFAQIGVRLSAGSRRDLAARTLLWSWLLAYGLVEVSWNPAHIDANCWTVVAAMTLLSRPPPPLAPDPGAADRLEASVGHR